MAKQKVINFSDTEKEAWKPIEGYGDFYEVSNKGRVRSIDRTIKYISHNQYGEFYQEEFKKGKVLSPGDNGKGYLQVNLSKENTQNVVCVHRLVAETFIPNPENKRTVNHIDGNKGNNKVDNLEWLSYSENHNHAYRNELMISGENHHFTNLSDKDVHSIRKRYNGDMRKAKSGITMAELAEEYGVSRSHINNIINNKKRKHVK